MIINNAFRVQTSCNRQKRQNPSFGTSRENFLELMNERNLSMVIQVKKGRFSGYLNSDSWGSVYVSKNPLQNNTYPLSISNTEFVPVKATSDTMDGMIDSFAAKLPDNHALRAINSRGCSDDIGVVEPPGSKFRVITGGKGQQ